MSPDCVEKNRTVEFVVADFTLLGLGGTVANKMRLSAYRDFHRSVERLQRLYEATMHSYQVMYDAGRQRLRSSPGRGETIALTFGTTKVVRPLRLITFHARDVYPELLRSTLLVRLVAGYEAFLIDVVQEVSERSMKPFLSDARVDFSHEQLLTIDQVSGVTTHIVTKVLRQLTSGGLKEIRKFYEKRLGVDIVVTPDDFDRIEEVHERRHLFVHRAGYADASYAKKFPYTGIAEGKKIPVPERYLSDSIKVLSASALHIKQSVEANFPSPPVRSYQFGSLVLPKDPPHLQFISFEPMNAAGRTGVGDLSVDIGDGRSLKEITVWASDDGSTIRMLVGGSAKQIKALGLALTNAERRGDLRRVEGFKLKR